MKRVLALVVLSLAVFILLPSIGFAQTKEDGLRLLKEADELREKPRSADDRKASLEKYQQVLSIFQKVGYREGLGVAFKNYGNLYLDWGQNQKALELYEKGIAAARGVKDRNTEALILNNIGLVYKNLGQNDKAVEIYEKCIALSKEVKERKGEALALNNLGDLYEVLGKYDKALEFYEKALPISRDMKNQAIEALILNNLGIVYNDWGQYDKAKDYYEKSLAIQRELKDRKGEGQTLNNLGLVFYDWGQHDKAVDCYEKSLAIKRELKDRKGEGQTLNNLGNVFQDWSQYDKAVGYYEKSLAISQEFNDRRPEGNALNNLGNVYRIWGKNDKAKEYYEKSLAIKRELKDRKGEGATLRNLGNIYADWGQYDKAVDYSQKSLAIMRELKDRKGDGNTLNNLGTVYMDWGQYNKAVDYYEKALAISREIKDRSGEGYALGNLGIVFKTWGQFDKAVDYYEKSLAIKRELKEIKEEGTTLSNLGNVFLNWGQYDKAVEYYEKALVISREIKDRSGEGYALYNLGLVYRDWGQYDKAVDFHEKALAIRRELKDRKGEGRSLSALGSVFQDRGDYKRALDNFQKGLSVWTQIGVPTQDPKMLIAGMYMDTGDLPKAEPLLKEAGYNSYWGRFYLLKSDYPRAKEYYRKVLKASEENRNADNIFTAYTGLASASEGLKDDVGAAEYYEKAVKYTEELRSSLSPAERVTFFDVRVNGFYRTAPYEGLARVQMRQHKPQDAFKTTEYTTARVFTETMSRMSEGKTLAVPAEIVKQDDSINNELASLKKNLQKAFEKKNKLVIDSLGPQVKQLEGKLQAHIKMLREKYPLFAATKYPQPMDLSQTDLKENEWVLAYHVTDPGIIIYLTKGKNLAKGLFKPIPRKDIDELVRKFRLPVELGPDDSLPKKLAAFDFKSGKKLSDLLLADILPHLPKATPLIIVPDGPLGVVPFEMLVLNNGGKIVTDRKRPQTSGAEFLGDRNPISYYQSITALTLARTLGKQQKPGDRTLAMVDPVFSPDDARLVKAATEKKQAMLDKLTGEKLMSFKSELSLDIPRLPLTTQLGESLKKADPAKTDLYEGMKAQKSELLQKDLTPYRSVLFGTHGYFGKDLPGIQEPVLILTLVDQPKDQDGFLRLSEVMGLKINCDIAALTACQTGLGRHISGEGTMGMGRAFQYAGARSVLMSLWSVSETSSVQLVESFFRHMKEGKNKLEALREARDEIRKAGYDHPFYWAPFILVGEVE